MIYGSDKAISEKLEELDQRLKKVEDMLSMVVTRTNTYGWQA